MVKAQASKTGILRPPIVTVLGHVDHGKTTLLDYIRKSKITSKEAGGITQSIGASQVVTKEGKKITFIDTPGHAAFSKMRSRGAKVADIALLAIAGDDGMKPQTKEALGYIEAADIPYIVVVTKKDLSSTKIDTIRGQLEKEGVTFEGRGGDVPLIATSGKTGEGINDLLEMIALVAEVHEIKADPKGDLEGVVIETSKDKRGPTVSAVLRNGTLKVGMDIVAGNVNARARGLFDDKGKSVKEIAPGAPVLILGFSKLPPVGAKIEFLVDKTIIQEKREGKTSRQAVEEGEIPVVIKAQSSGSLEDLLANLPEGVVVIYSGIGDVNESDVFMAKSTHLEHIFAFESKVPTKVAKLAETEGVEIETFEIIYELFERLEELIKEGQTEVLGKAEILAEFPFNNRRVAGSKVLQGRIRKGDSLVLMRGPEERGEARAVSMKKQKQNINEVKEGEEFGIIIEPQLDFKLGDMILSVRKKK